MLRSNSRNVAYNGDDDDDQQLQQNGTSEMLRSISLEYTERRNRRIAMSRQNTSVSDDGCGGGSGSGLMSDDDDGGIVIDSAADIDADLEQEEAIGINDPALENVDIDYRDPSELNPETFGDLFQLVKSDPSINRRVNLRDSKLRVALPVKKSAVSSVSAANVGPQQQSASQQSASTSTTAATSAAVDKMMTNSTKNDETQVEEKEISINISPADGVEMFIQEVETAQMVYGEDQVEMQENIDAKSYMRTVKVQVLSPTDIADAEQKRNRRTKGLWISFVKPVKYPIAPLEPFVEPWHNIFTFQEVQLIYKAMLEVAESTPELPCLFNMIQTASSLASQFIAQGEQQLDDDKRDYFVETMRKAGYPVRLSHERLTPTVFCGSVSSILNRIPKGWDVMYVENVMRADLAKRFEAMQRHFFKIHVASKIAKFGSETEGNILKANPTLAKLADVMINFHGTRMGAIESIVNQGLMMPSTDKNAKVRVRTGARYGRGIYSTRNMELALNYAENGRVNEYSVKIIVVAVLPGLRNVILDGEEPWGGGLIDKDKNDKPKGYNSHESEDGDQTVVFNAAQILPLYVLHLMERKKRVESNVADLGRGDKTDEVKRQMRDIMEQYGVGAIDELEEKRRHGGSSSQTKKKAGMAALAEAERKKILTALARKNLPFGFGPAGSNFVVEEIAEYSDDDEDFDEYVGVDDHASAEVVEEYQYARDYSEDWNKKHTHPNAVVPPKK